jgi:hypothetical protein
LARAKTRGKGGANFWQVRFGFLLQCTCS